MRLLFIGGTRYVGSKMVEAALARGHEVTLFNRGQTNPDRFTGCEKIVGDRTGELGALAGRRWDAVIDVCGYWPKAVEPLCRALVDSVERYVFVSTISVYSEESPDGLTEETGVLLENGDPEATELVMEQYGGLKVLCERVVTKWFGERTLIVRPGLVVGPGDHSDRFTYWPRKFMQPGPFLVPDCRDLSMQVIDGRDLGEFTVHATKRGHSGAFHVAGPTPAMTLGGLIDTGVKAGGGVAEPVWVSCSRLVEAGVEPWSDLPLVSSLLGERAPLVDVDNSKAVGAGLVMRPIEQTIAETIDWWRAERQGTEPRWGLSDERERDLLDLLKPEASLS